MIAKVVTGSSFALALAYGAGKLGKKNEKEKRDKVSMIDSMNVLGSDHAEIAAEMNAVVRDNPSRCKQPVLHLILSIEAGTTLTKRQWQEAISMYAKALKIDTSKHQLVAYQHHDREHPHVHIYINRVPMSGGKAISTKSSYIKSVLVAREMENHFKMRVLTEKEEYKARKELPEPAVTALRMKHWIKKKQGTTGELAKLIVDTVNTGKIKTPDELVDRLKAVDVKAKIIPNKNGPGITFAHPIYGHFKGSALGLKWGTVAKMLSSNEDLAHRLRLAKLEAIQEEEAPALPKVVVPTAPTEPIQAKPTPPAAIEKTPTLPPAVVSTVPTEPIQAKPTPPAAIEEAPTLPPVVVSTAPTVPTPAKPAPALSPVVVPTQVEIKDRLLKFYAFVGVGANGKYNNRNIFKFIDRANKVDDGLKMVAESLAKDFVDSVQAADLLEKQILHDYKHEPSGYPPFEFVFRYTQNPSKKQFTDREIGADSAAWQTVQHQSNTFSQPEKELFEQLQKEYFSYKGGLQLDLKNGRKLKQ